MTLETRPHRAAVPVGQAPARSGRGAFDAERVGGEATGAGHSSRRAATPGWMPYSVTSDHDAGEYGEPVFHARLGRVPEYEA